MVTLCTITAWEDPCKLWPLSPLKPAVGFLLWLFRGWGGNLDSELKQEKQMKIYGRKQFGKYVLWKHWSRVEGRWADGQAVKACGKISPSQLCSCVPFLAIASHSTFLLRKTWKVAWNGSVRLVPGTHVGNPDWVPST